MEIKTSGLQVEIFYRCWKVVVELVLGDVGTDVPLG